MDVQLDYQMICEQQKIIFLLFNLYHTRFNFLWKQWCSEVGTRGNVFPLCFFQIIIQYFSTTLVSDPTLEYLCPHHRLKVAFTLHLFNLIFHILQPCTQRASTSVFERTTKWQSKNWRKTITLMQRWGNQIIKHSYLIPASWLRKHVCS